MTSIWASPMAVRIVSPVPSSRWIRIAGSSSSSRWSACPSLSRSAFDSGSIATWSDGAGNSMPGQLDGLRSVGDERVTGRGRGQLGDGGDVAGADLREVVLVLALDREERSDPLLLLSVDVVDMALPRERAAEDTEVGQAADERVGGGLEDLGDERSVRVRLDLLAVDRGARADLGGRGDVLDDHLRQLADADVLRRRARRRPARPCPLECPCAAPTRSPRR